MLLAVLSLSAIVVVIAYFAVNKKNSKLKEYEVPEQEPEIKHEIAEVDPVYFEDEPIEEIPAPVVEPKPKKTVTKKQATKKTAAKKTTAKKAKTTKDGK